jgi:hypothetical protein
MTGLLNRLVIPPIPAEQLTVPALRHPPSSREVTIIRTPRLIRLPFGVNAQHDLRDLAPSALGSSRRIYVMTCCSSYTVSAGSEGVRSATLGSRGGLHMKRLSRPK